MTTALLLIAGAAVFGGVPTDITVTLSAEEHLRRLEEFGDLFFDEKKLQRPAEFVEALQRMSPASVDRIPDVIARGRTSHSRSEGVTAADVWEDMKRHDVIVFRYSGGGDGVTAIAWSPIDHRFYHLWECC